MMTNVSVSVIDNSTVALTRDLSQLSDKPVRIKAIKGGKYILAAGDLGIAPANIVAKRMGKDLQVSLEGENPDAPRLIIEDFFEKDGELVGLAQDGTYHPYMVAAAEGGSDVAFLPEGIPSPLALSEASLAGLQSGSLSATGDFFSTYGAWLAGLGGLLGIAAASGGGGGGSGSKNNGAQPPVEPAPQPPVLPSTPAPVSISDASGSNNQPVLSGTGRPGDTVQILDNGVVIGEVVIGESGGWSFIPHPALGDGEHSLTVVIRDPAGNVSDESEPVVLVVDTVAPDAPGFNELPGSTSENPIFGGTGTPGETIVIRDNGKEIGSVVVQPDGSWSFAPNPALSEGGHSITVEAVDAAGNVSIPSTPKDIIIDTVAPDAPAAQVTGNGDGTLTVVGTGEPGSTVSVTFPDGSTASAVVDHEGNYSLNSPAGVAQPNGELVVTATDIHGNTSKSTTVSYEDTQAPDAPTAAITDNGNGILTVVGTGEPGSTVNVIFPDGSIGIVVVDESGHYSVDSPAGMVQPEGELVINVTDINGNTSENTTAPYEDTQAPDAPTAAITDNGDGTLTLVGTGEPGATVNVIFPDGSIGIVVVDESGHYSVDSPAGMVQPEGELVINVTDINGNTSENTTVSYADSQAPDAPTAAITDNGDGTLTLVGTGEPGSTVNVIFPDGSTGSVVVDVDGNYSLNSPAGIAQPDGELVVSVTDVNGNTSENTTVSYEDSQAPDAPTATITDNGDGTLTLVGTGEPGSTVNVTFPDGSTGSVVVDVDGNYSLNSPAGVAQPDGELVVSVTDVNGNTSENTTVAYADTQAPDAPTATITDNGDGTLTLVGTGEPGATVNVIFPDGSTASVVVDVDGNYSLNSPAGIAQPDGELVVSVTDVNGNTSENTTVTYADTQAPDAPTATITDNGDGTLTLVGTGEPGSTVNVIFPDGSTGSVVVDVDGNYSLNSPAGIAQPDGELVVNVTDINGNTSENTTVSYEDSQAPDAPTAAITDNGDGTLTLVGTGEPGAIVNVTFPDGSTGSVVVDGDGNYTLNSPAGVAQPDGELVVSVTDVNGNTSEETTVAYADTQAPDAPTATITDNGDGTLTLVGTGEPGATVNVIFPDGSTASVVVDVDGNYSLNSPAGIAQPDGELVVSVTDVNGNTSENTTVTYADTQAPDAPTATITDNGDGTLTLVGTGEPGSTVNVIFPDGSTGSVVVDVDGNYSLNSPAGIAQPDGELVVNVTDINGNTSENTTVSYEDSQAPDAPTAAITDNGDGTLTLVGTGEPGAIVNVTFPDGSTGSVVVDGDGNYTLNSPAGVAQPDGELVVSVTDVNGNTSEETTVAYADTQAPDAPTATITDNGDGTLTLVGTGEPGATVNVIFPDGSTASVVVDVDGNYSLNSPADIAQPDGELVVSVTDVNGNTSENTTVTYADTQAPDAPTATITDKGDGTLTLVGTGEPGSTVNVIFPDGSTGSVVVDESGHYSIDSPVGVVQPDGELVVNVTDVNGNTSSDAAVLYVDTQAPDAPTATITDNGDGTLTLVGTGEPGATVSVTFPDGSMGSVVVDGDGNYTLNSPAGVAQPDGELVVSATDINGNTSENTTVTFTDTQAPDAPTAAAMGKSNGSITVSGSGEPGATVNITFPDGSTASAVVDASGNFSIDSPSGVVQPEGELLLTVTDVNGNTSENTTVAYVDTQAPDVPTAVISNNGDGTLTLAGTGEPGSTVNVTFPDGSTANAVVDASGNYSIASPTGIPQPEGNLVVTVTDINGNTSDDTVVYVDFVAPDAPAFDDLPSIVGNGSPSLNGTAQPGETIVIYDNDVEIGRLVVGEEGAWSYTPEPALSHGEHRLSVEAMDAAGNVSERTEQVILVDTTAPTQTVSVASMTKDTGSSHTDLKTNDGSAGRLLQGKLSAALAAHETLQVSTDGGNTWVNAVTNGQDWAAQDLNSHASDWTIQTRVIDSFGREGATTSVSVAMDASAPTAPSSVAISNKSVVVNLLPGAVAGDKVLVVADGNRVEYVLQGADITAKKATISLPAYTSTARVSIEDSAGNVSAVVEAPQVSYQDNFSSYGKQAGTVVRIDNMTFTAEPTIGLGLNQWASGLNSSNSITVGSTSGKNTGTVLVELNRAATKVSIGALANCEYGKVYFEFYDALGNVVGRCDPPNSNYTGVTFTADARGPASYFKIVVTEESNGFYFGIITVDYVPLAHDTNTHEVVKNFSYVGGADVDTFVVGDTSVFNGFIGSIEGGKGTDILKLMGAGQLLDLSTLGNKMTSVEVVDITGTGDNTLKLSLSDVLGQGSMDLFHANGDVQMMVKGDAGDTVVLEDMLSNGITPGVWNTGGTVTVEGVDYVSYQYSTMDAELLVQQGVQVNLV